MQTIHVDNSALVAGLQAGNAEAFEALLRLSSAALLRTARRFLRSEEDARDAVQDAYVSLFKSIGSFESHSQLSTWLQRIVINSCLMRLRRRRRHPEEDIESVPPPRSTDAHPIEHLHRAQMRSIV